MRFRTFHNVGSNQPPPPPPYGIIVNQLFQLTPSLRELTLFLPNNRFLARTRGFGVSLLVSLTRLFVLILGRGLLGSASGGGVGRVAGTLDMDAVECCCSKNGCGVVSCRCASCCRVVSCRLLTGGRCCRVVSC